MKKQDAKSTAPVPQKNEKSRINDPNPEIDVRLKLNDFNNVVTLIGANKITGTNLTVMDGFQLLTTLIRKGTAEVEKINQEAEEHARELRRKRDNEMLKSKRRASRRRSTPKKKAEDADKESSAAHSA